MKVTPLASLDVFPEIPQGLKGLRDLAYNLKWSWNPDIYSLFRSLDPVLWEEVGRNPARLLREISQERLDEAAASTAFLSQYDRCLATLERYLKESTWFNNVCSECAGQQVVYFSMEYGISECLPIYSGGLGVLSGDHVKSSSDLGLPLVAIGLAYRQGYFQQQLTSDGYQTELYPENDFSRLPVTPVLDASGKRLTISLSFPGRSVHVGAWKAVVGRVSLYLLDTDQPENSPTDRRITYMLYGGDKETRIQQEIVLGIGGITLAEVLGVQTTVCHMNEGHSAFIQLARVSRVMREKRLSLSEALTFVSAGTVFTTHTPVPAGIDQFPSDLMDRYFGHVLPELGIGRNDFLALGNRQPGVPGQLFNMAIFALRTSDHANGVSRLHADVSRSLWEESWPNLPHEEIPIEHVTNGIHVRTWLGESMAALYDRHLGSEWRNSPDHREVWSRVHEIPDEELWDAHIAGRRRLVEFARQRIAEQTARATGAELTHDEIAALLDPDILTIGFARRFATYKRATLLLRYPERLLALLRNKERPLQIVFAGKAHPQDDAGKALIRDIIYFARANRVEHRLVFLENYDMAVARYLVQGVDVWLNTPRRPLEASGTSGMKVLANGGLNLSVLDGWWDEAYEPDFGWAIGRGRVSSDEKIQDERDAASLYETLERQIVPLFYQVEHEGLPRRWIAKMKDSIAELVPRFSSHRMVKEYCEDYYIPALKRCHKLAQDQYSATRELSAWVLNIQANWEKLRIVRVKTERIENVQVGRSIRIEATVELGNLRPEDVEVQVYFGALRADGTIGLGGWKPLDPLTDELGVFAGEIAFPESGRIGYTVRIVPAHPLMGNALKMGLVHWASSTVVS